jgi:hypothetical protein
MGAAPLVIGLVGTAISAASAIQRGSDEANISKIDAQTNATNAALAAQNTAMNLQRQSIISTKQIGMERAQFGATGAQSTTGSALDVLADSASNAERDKLAIQQAGTARVLGFQNEENLYNMRAGFAGSEAGLSAAGTLLGGTARAYSEWGSGT